MGITRDTPDPDGGKIGRGEDGGPNGYLEETAFTLYSQAAPAARLDTVLPGAAEGGKLPALRV